MCSRPEDRETARSGFAVTAGEEIELRAKADAFAGVFVSFLRSERGAGAR